MTEEIPQTKGPRAAGFLGLSGKELQEMSDACDKFFESRGMPQRTWGDRFVYGTTKNNKQAEPWKNSKKS